MLDWILAAAMSASTPVIVDTDAGTDDLMAIAYLLATPSVKIEAITVVNGLAHVDAGGRNILRLLELAGASGTPVYLGSRTALRFTAEFPDEWRRVSDHLPAVRLPEPRRAPGGQAAAEFLAARLAQGQAPVSILALGPLTNLAIALQRNPGGAQRIARLVIMGGALRVAGNLGDGGLFKTSNVTAEWNIFCDPLAAQIVFASRATIHLVPLDATNHVPIGPSFLAEFERRAKTPLGRFVTQVLESDRAIIEAGYFHAWDPLAAVALVHPEAVHWTPLAVEVVQDGNETGRTRERPGQPANIRAALDASPEQFRTLFLAAFR